MCACSCIRRETTPYFRSVPIVIYFWVLLLLLLFAFVVVVVVVCFNLGTEPNPEEGEAGRFFVFFF